MKLSEKRIKIVSLAAGVTVITMSALMTVFLLLMSIHALKPRKTQITLYTDNVDYLYSGSVFDGSRPELIYGKLEQGHTLSCVAVAQRIEPGSQKNAPQYVILDEAENDVTDMYRVKEEWGDLTVNRIKLVVSTSDASKIYDGEPLSSNLAHLVSGDLMAYHQAEFKGVAELTEVGETDNIAAATITDRYGNDVSNYYEVVTEPGKLTVEPIKIHLAISETEKIYDGTPLSNEGWKLVGGSLLSGDKMEPVSYAQITSVGSVKNAVTFSVTDKNGKDVSHRYAFVFPEEYLRITPVRLVLETGSAEKKYDGKALECDEWSLTGGKLPEDHRIEVKCSSRTSVGISQNVITGFAVYKKLPNGKEIDVTDCFVYSYAPGTLTVLP